MFSIRFAEVEMKRETKGDAVGSLSPYLLFRHIHSSLKTFFKSVLKKVFNREKTLYNSLKINKHRKHLLSFFFFIVVTDFFPFISSVALAAQSIYI